ncbi:uncharacterized protein BDV14DRAFT_138514 [Aspergillus stella-maris]|uniref:uncharacterized protein n=1 Tax=Aspergillus stella-maris TaxID=1810926 RepID=UPI003CCD4547
MLHAPIRSLQETVGASTFFFGKFLPLVATVAQPCPVAVRVLFPLTVSTLCHHEHRVMYTITPTDLPDSFSNSPKCPGLESSTDHDIFMIHCLFTRQSACQSVHQKLRERPQKSRPRQTAAGTKKRTLWQTQSCSLHAHRCSSLGSTLYSVGLDALCGDLAVRKAID